MAKGADNFLKKTLGDDFFESLQKFELWKPGTKTTLDHEEIKTALQIVPRAIMSFLIYHLSSMQIGENKVTQLPVQESGAMLHVTKHERDVYSGHIEYEGKSLVDFKFRSIPGVGLVVMSAFELYDVDKIAAAPQQNLAEGAEDKVQKLIDDRLALHDLINKVVDNKIAQKEAIHKLMLMKLTEELEAIRKIKHDISNLAQISKQSTDNEYHRGMANGMAVADAVVNKKEPEFVDAPKKKGSPLKGFLDSHKKKKEFSVELAKGENVNCPDCGKNIFDGKLFSGCICLGDDMERKVFIKKTEEGITVRFSKGWDQENIEMLLEVMRRKRG